MTFCWTNIPHSSRVRAQIPSKNTRRKYSHRTNRIKKKVIRSISGLTPRSSRVWRCFVFSECASGWAIRIVGRETESGFIPPEFGNKLISFFGSTSITKHGHGWVWLVGPLFGRYPLPLKGHTFPRDYDNSLSGVVLFALTGWRPQNCHISMSESFIRDRRWWLLFQQGKTIGGDKGKVGRTVNPSFDIALGIPFPEDVGKAQTYTRTHKRSDFHGISERFCGMTMETFCRNSLGD